MDRWSRNQSAWARGRGEPPDSKIRQLTAFLSLAAFARRVNSCPLARRDTSSFNTSSSILLTAAFDGLTVTQSKRSRGILHRHSKWAGHRPWPLSRIASSLPLSVVGLEGVRFMGSWLFGKKG